MIAIALDRMVSDGESQRAAKVMDRVMRQADQWDMGQYPWIEAAVHKEFAHVLLKLGREKEAAERLRMSLAKASDAEGLASVVKVLVEAKAWDAAVALAKKIPSGEKRRLALVPVLVAAGKFDDLAKILAEVKTAKEACDLAWRVVLGAEAK
jgi:hypothetical protein